MKGIWTPERKDAFWVSWLQKIKAREKRWPPLLRKLFKAQEAEVLEQLDNSVLLGKYAGWSHRKVRADIIKQDIPNIDESKWRVEFEEKGGALIHTIYQEAGEDSIELISDISFDLSNPRAVQWIKARTADFAEDVNRTTARKIRKTLSEGFVEGESIDQLKKRVKSVFKEATTSRAETIARTETMTASNAAGLESYVQAGVPKKSWLSARDPVTRESHLEADTRYSEDGYEGPIPVMDTFIIEGLPAMHPGGFGVPEQDIACRCVVIPVFED